MLGIKKNRCCIRHVHLVVLIVLSLVKHAIADDSVRAVVEYSEKEESQVIEVEAKRWGLSVEEFQHYQDLMKGPLGHWNPHIDPVLALGIMADNAIDRVRFAERYATQEHELTVKTLAFQRVYREAFSRLFPESSVIDSQWLEPYYQNKEQSKVSNARVLGQQPTLKNGDRLLYFPSVHCLECGLTIVKLIAKVASFKIGIDVYVKGAVEEKKVRIWARNNKIEMTWINRQQMTLNVDNGLYKRLKEKIKDDGANFEIFLLRGSVVYGIDRRALQL